MAPIPYQAPGPHSEARYNISEDKIRAKLLKLTENFDMEQLFRKEASSIKTYEIENMPTTRRERFLAEVAYDIACDSLQIVKRRRLYPILATRFHVAIQKLVKLFSDWLTNHIFIKILIIVRSVKTKVTMPRYSIVGHVRNMVNHQMTQIRCICILKNIGTGT
ncbi:hypothetical protein [Candidatus Odyssella thessalonicensis]|uniref:hypothetical protein n=1 Tax=Candidatus Odyssella thessalonicensis TaxID=84647 RepID=UPI000225AC2C|nr:hypothetical protein [Candidatus Odyssella thessalonicensis]